jgi:hypothetical protein
MSQWQPIETAPKDGTQVLVWWRDFGTLRVASWSDEWQQWIFWFGFVAEPAAIPCHELGKNHTHWMPLPPPPEQNGPGT